MHPADHATTTVDFHTDLALCPAAGIAWQPAPQPYVYGEDYFQNYVERKGTDIAMALNRARAQVVSQALGPASSDQTRNLIDMGIGSGEFIDFVTALEGQPGCWMERHRIGDVTGFDINPVAIEWLNQRDRFRDPHDGVESHEVLTLWDTLEHLPDPDALFDAMAPGSTLCTSLPIYDRIDRDEILASKHYKPNEHLYYFTVGGLITWMERSGFQFLFWNDAETRAGRESIFSFAFRKR